MRNHTLTLLILLALTAPVSSGPVFQTPSPAGVSALRGFAAWAGGPGAPVMSLYPQLASLKRLDFSRPETLGALSPILARLRPESLKQLESLSEQSPGRQQLLVMELESARQAGSEVAGHVLLEAFKNEPDWESLQSEVTAVGVYGDWGTAAQKVIEQKVAEASVNRTSDTTIRIADRLAGASTSLSASKVFQVEDNVIHVDFGKKGMFTRRQAGPEVEATWDLDPVARKPSAAIKKRYNDLKRQLRNAETLLESELGTSSAKITPRLQMEKRTAKARLNILETNFPQLKGDFTYPPARLAASRPPSQGKEVTAEAIATYKKLVREAREIELFQQWRSSKWKMLLTGNLEEYRRIKQHPFYQIPKRTLEETFYTKAAEIDILMLEYPGVGTAARREERGPRGGGSGNGAHKKNPQVDWGGLVLFLVLPYVLPALIIVALILAGGLLVLLIV